LQPDKIDWLNFAGIATLQPKAARNVPLGLLRSKSDTVPQLLYSSVSKLLFWR
jgi:hypothetical protein